MPSNRPVVLAFSGHDPSGGAGIQADIEAMISHQCHACSVITALTEQDSRNVKKLIPQNPNNLVRQANTLLSDFKVSAFKIGLIGHHETAEAIFSILKRNPDIPVILDPVLAAGGGTNMANDQLIKVISDKLIPVSTVLTPNSQEARSLTHLQNLNDCGHALVDKGADFFLITGTHEQSQHVDNQVFMAGQSRETYTWERLPNSYHGSGCTLASTIAALIAHGLEPFTAITEAQEYTWNSLQAAYQPGQGQFNPNRLFWMEN